ERLHTPCVAPYRHRDPQQDRGLPVPGGPDVLRHRRDAGMGKRERGGCGRWQQEDPYQADGGAQSWDATEHRGGWSRTRDCGAPDGTEPARKSEQSWTTYFAAVPRSLTSRRLRPPAHLLHSAGYCNPQGGTKKFGMAPST